MRSAVELSVKTIENQAKKLGFEVKKDTAATGTTYLTVWSEKSGEKLIRVSDHEPNDSRYKFNVNQEPDLFIDAGFQVAAIKWLANLAGIDHNSVSYLKSAATRTEKKEQVKQERSEKEDADRRELKAVYNWAMGQLQEPHASVFEDYAQTSGKKRKSFRKSGMYRKAVKSLESLKRNYQSK